jgi:hypothetical protein
LARRLYLDARCWLIVIQAYGRRYVERKRYLTKLENIITVQSCARRYMIVSSPDLRKAKAAKSERKQLAEDAARISVRKFMKRFRKKQDKERKERVQKKAGAVEEDEPLLVEDSVLCHTLDASHFCMEDSALTRLLDNDNYCLDENAFCRVLDAVENIKDENEGDLSNHDVPLIKQEKTAKIANCTTNDEEVEEINDGGLCYENSIFAGIFDNDLDYILCRALDQLEAKTNASTSKSLAGSPLPEQIVPEIENLPVDSIKVDEVVDSKAEREVVGISKVERTQNIQVESIEAAAKVHSNQVESHTLEGAVGKRIELAVADQSIEAIDVGNHEQLPEPLNSRSLMDGVTISSDHSETREEIPTTAAEKADAQQAAVEGIKDASESISDIATAETSPSRAQIKDDTFAPEAPPTVKTDDFEQHLIETLNAANEDAASQPASVSISFRTEAKEGEQGIDVYAASVLDAAEYALKMTKSADEPIRSIPVYSVVNASHAPTRDTKPAVALFPNHGQQLNDGTMGPDFKKAQIILPFMDVKQIDGSGNETLAVQNFFNGFPVKYPFPSLEIAPDPSYSIANEPPSITINSAAENLKKQMESLTAVRAEIDEVLRLSGRVVYRERPILTTEHHSPTTVQSINLATTAANASSSVVQPSKLDDLPPSFNASLLVGTAPFHEMTTEEPGEGNNDSEAEQMVDSILDSCRQQAAAHAGLPRAPTVEHAIGSSARSLQYLVRQKHEQHAKQFGASSIGSEQVNGSVQEDQSTIQTYRETSTLAENSDLTSSTTRGFKMQSSFVPFIIQAHEMKGDQTMAIRVPPTLPCLEEDIPSTAISKGVKVEVGKQSLSAFKPISTAQSLPNSHGTAAIHGSQNLYKSRASYLLALASAKKQNIASATPIHERIST